jgi:phosphoribosylamine-glycine ligase
VIGPEAPLAAGVADAVRSAGIACFGPGRSAAMIEGSKSFAKQTMTAAGIPTAAAATCETEAEVSAALDAFGPPYVVKADGLATGKGVVVTPDRREADEHARASGRVVIEEFLDGPEVSVFALADGKAATVLLPAQDYKRARDGDAGPNTRFGDPETQVILDRLETPLAGLLRAAATGSLAGAGPLSWTGGRPSPWWWPPRVTRARQRPVMRSAAWRMRNGYLAPMCCTQVPAARRWRAGLGRRPGARRRRDRR